MESWSVCLLVFIVMIAVARKAFLAFMSSSSYKKWFATIQSAYALKFNKVNRHLKEALFAKLQEGLQAVNGDVLEIAIGTGANLEFFPPDTSLIALDYNPHMEKILKTNLAKFPHVRLKKFLLGDVLDGVKVDENSVAAVVCTHFLCNLTDKEAMTVLQEVKRILKPGGRFIFLEHVAAEQGTLQRYLQNLMTWTGIWPSVFDGCVCNSESWHALHRADFRTVSYDKLYTCPISGPILHSIYYFVSFEIMGYAEV